MNHKQKKYRQTSLIESFAFSKRQKTNKTNYTPLNDTTESVCFRMSSADLNEFVNVSQAAEEIKNKDTEVDDKTPTLKPETTKQCSDSSSFQKSEDMFPKKSPSLEDCSVPNSRYSDESFPDSNKDSSEHAKASKVNDSEELDHLTYLNRIPDCSIPLPKLEPLENHAIMFSPHILPGDAPLPYPSSYSDAWGDDHVRMPCSPLNRYPVKDAMGEKHFESGWDLICRSLRNDIVSSQDLEEAIRKYSSEDVGRWNFLGLHAFINKHLTEEERDHFFKVLLPAMIEMTLNLPNICTQPIPLLKKGNDHYITMSQKQIGCLLLNAFFCTFPRRNLPSIYSKQRWSFEYATYPDINFHRLFDGTKNGIISRNAEKLKCLLNYFRRITSEEPSGTITFHRQSLQYDDFPKWHTSTKGIGTAVIKSSGLIEVHGHGMLQVDFADKFVGGRVIGVGCVQEEIRFVVCPDLIVSRLFVEMLDDNEVLIVTGAEQFNKYSGYFNTFKWEEDFRDVTPRDSWGRRYTQVVAMDATPFQKSDSQFKSQFIRRELNKAYCAFYENALPAHLPTVATGNWGCGVFKGNPNLKFLIQLMAASETGRSLLYFTFEDKALKKQLQDMCHFLTDKNLSVGDVWKLLMQYESVLTTKKYSNLYDFIYSQFSYDDDCRQQDDGSSEEQSIDGIDIKAAISN